MPSMGYGVAVAENHRQCADSKSAQTLTPSCKHSCLPSPYAEKISTDDLRKEILEWVIKQVVPEDFLDDWTIYHVRNGLAFQLVGQRSEFAPSQIQQQGRIIIGGPQGGAFMTGRKITVEMFGG